MNLIGLPVPDDRQCGSACVAVHLSEDDAVDADLL
jgi:hypothetical protein